MKIDLHSPNLIPPACIKDEPVDVLDTHTYMHPGHAGGHDGVLHTDMSTVDMKPTDIEIEVSLHNHPSDKMKQGKSKQVKVNARENQAYERRYMWLKKQCEKLEQKNERMLHRLHSVSKIMKQYKKERKFLMDRLDQHSDNYREAPAALPYETQEGNKAIVSAVKQLATSKKGKGGGATEGTPHSRKKSKMEVKDPNAPKKPVNAYVMFFQHSRHSVQENYFKEHNTDIGNHELTRIVGQQWNNLTVEQKQVFYDLYEKDKERYQREFKEYEINKGKEGVTSNLVTTCATNTTTSISPSTTVSATTTTSNTASSNT